MVQVVDDKFPCLVKVFRIAAGQCLVQALAGLGIGLDQGTGSQIAIGRRQRRLREDRFRLGNRSAGLQQPFRGIAGLRMINRPRL